MQIETPIPSAPSKGETSSIADHSGFVTIDGEAFYRIADSDRMAPFLMNIVSGSNHWMFAASNGALTAGRRNADNALFPYCTQDKLFESSQTVGSCSLVWVETDEGNVLWEPFRQELRGTNRSRNLYKSSDGNCVIFEEVDSALGLSFRYSWTMGDRFGFVRRAQLKSLGGASVKVRILDGIQNMVPYGLDQAFVSHFSNLADAYKKNELLSPEGIGIYYLSSIPTDRAEPSEGLKATVVWSTGLDREAVLLSSKQIEAYRSGSSVAHETETRGERCSYLVQSSFVLESGTEKKWWLVADINQDAMQIERLQSSIGGGLSLESALNEDIQSNGMALRSKVGASDGLQLTSNGIRDARHRSNTLFNIMRGGAFNDGYTISVADFKNYLASWNRDTLAGYGEILDSFEDSISRDELLDWVEIQDDLDLYRLACEYLPLSFSRRHGDPSRPWNKFSIETEDENGNPVLAYQGNWRDIFQNWEPLGYSYPSYLTGMISRFLNATTADGYNPYRVTRDGFDWEILDPDEPWSNIGYWGDHQIVYLLKLLEALEKHSPDSLRELLDKECFVYADVPYRIRGFSETWKDPRQTVTYDDAASERLAKLAGDLGADGKLLRSQEGRVVRANFVEKLLNPLLAKMSNFVVDGGIWMNTQRPEWNDANNALVGYGVSVVTLCYVNRYLEFLNSIFEGSEDDRLVRIDPKLAKFLRDQIGVMKQYQAEVESGKPVSSKIRYEVLAAFGKTGEEYRENVYGSQLGEAKEVVSLGEIRSYLEHALVFVGHSIESNRRPDAMFHSYNLLEARGNDEVEIGRLSEMLEGQVAALSSNRLGVEDALALLESLRTSALYRQDVESYTLYPDKELPQFLAKNQVPADRVESSELLSLMLEKGDERIVAKSGRGIYRFNGAFRNAGDLEDSLGRLTEEYPELKDSSSVGSLVALFEDTFNHRSFTGRSGTFFAYEGLGSVYWHMVSKLVLAIQENSFKAKGTDSYDALVKHYFECLHGLGFDKTPEEYGAFPIDAYSHTPKQAGAQQPGMTGQVKEDILSRWGELGVKVSGGVVRFDPQLLMKSEFIQETNTFDYTDVWGETQSCELFPSSLAFTYCQTLIVYKLAEFPGVHVELVDGSSNRRAELKLLPEESESLFARNGRITRIEVSLTSEHLCTLG